MPDSDHRSPLAMLNDDLDEQSIRQLTHRLVARIKGAFDPDIESRCALAILRAQSGQLAQARALLDEARLIDPVNLMSYNLRIQLESQAGPSGEGDRWMRRHARIEGAKTKGRKHSRADIAPLMERTQKLVQKGRLQDVSDVLEDFLFSDVLGPGLDNVAASELYHRLADYKTQLGWAESAWRSRNAAVILNPANEDAVKGYLDNMPVDPQWSQVPPPTNEAWDLPDEEGSEAAVHALNRAGITASHHREVLQRTARLPIHAMDVLDLGDVLPIAFTRTLGAHSWVGQKNDAPSEIDGTYRLGPIDFDSIESDAFDCAFLHGSATADANRAIQTLERVLRPGGQALVLLGPAWSSAWGHGLVEKGKTAPAPDWSHLLWGDSQRQQFARICGIHPDVLKVKTPSPTAQTFIEAIQQSGLMVKSHKVVRRNYPVPHVQFALEQAVPNDENIHDWGYEVLFERA